jgi:putative ABC transport system permease protein
MTVFLQNLRYALRMLVRAPGFTVVAAITLALGIGANTAIFSIVSGILLRKPPVRDPDRVMLVLSTNRAKGWGGGPEHPASTPDFLDWKRENRSFEELAAIDPWLDFSLTGQGEPQHVNGMRVSANFFHLLGVPAVLGRTFVAGEDQVGREHEVVLSYGLWQSQFASDRNMLGKTLKINGQTYSVIGVMPASLKFLDFPVQIWTPLTLDAKQLSPEGRQSRTLYVFGRLKPRVTVVQAQSEFAAISHRLEQRYPEADKGWDAALISLQEFQIQDFYVRPALLLLMGAVGFVLLIACANVAGLVLARGIGRQHELAVRAALGAGRGRLVRQLLSENIVLAAAGAVLGLALAAWGVRALHAAASYNEWVRSMDFGIDKPVLVFVGGISLLALLVFGLVPAIQISGCDLHAALKESGRTGTAGIARGRARRVFVVAEVALALVLLTGAGLMIKSFLEALTSNPGFSPGNLLIAEVSLPDSKYPNPSQQRTFFQHVIDRVQGLPGAVSAAASSSLPLTAQAGSVSFTIEGRSSVRMEERPQAKYYASTPDYLRTMQVPLLRGREFTNSDNEGAPPVVLVNQEFVRRFLPKGDAIGQHITLYIGTGASQLRCEVVGIVGNVRDFFGQPNFNPQIYAAFLQVPSADMTLVVRTKTSPALVAPGVRNAVWAIDKDQPLGNVMEMGQLVEARGAGGDRLMGELLGIFAGLALLLAAVGLYGIIAHGVSQRTHEIGIRMALGANRGSVLRLVISEGMMLAAIGLAFGLAAAYPLPRLFNAAFEGFSVHSAWVFLIAPGLLISSTLLASYIPARKATGVDPIIALRYE